MRWSRYSDTLSKQTFYYAVKLKMEILRSVGSQDYGQSFVTMLSSFFFLEDWYA